MDLVGGPTGGLPSHPYIVRPFPTPVVWNDPFSGTNWISPGLASNKLDAPAMAPGTYFYNLYFTLPTEFSFPRLSTQYFTDNDMGSVTLNGNFISFTPSPQITMGHAETTNSSFFKSGINKLTIGVVNWNGGWNPTGVDLTGLVTYIPEILSNPVDENLIKRRSP